MMLKSLFSVRPQCSWKSSNKNHMGILLIIFVIYLLYKITRLATGPSKYVATPNVIDSLAPRHYDNTFSNQRSHRDHVIDLTNHLHRPASSVHTRKPDILIEYQDVKGDITKRRITPYYTFKNHYWSDDNYMRAFCHLRNEERTFRKSRILSSLPCN